MSTIVRPEVEFDAATHTYKLNGEAVLGVSTIAKIGGAEDSFGIASAWGFRIGYEGAWDVLAPLMDPDAVESCGPTSKDGLRESLKRAGLTPWTKRDKAAERGTFVHDTLEALAQEGDIPALDSIENDEERGHVESVLKWYSHFRPSIVAQEVQVASVTHGFSGRYDMRAKIDARRIVEHLDPLRDDPAALRLRELAGRGEPALGLLDLKTSKGIYPTTHFPQLEGYEGAGVEMGYPATDFRAVINTWPTGDFDPARDMAVSWASYDDFIAYKGALEAIRRIKFNDPQERRQRMVDEAILGALPARSRDIAGSEEILRDVDARGVGYRLGALKRRGIVRQGAGGVWERAS